MPRKSLLFQGLMKNPELLLPVGDKEMCLAAIHGGADAIYIGMPGFNARGRTVDLTFLELKEMIEICHLHDVKVHVAFNILIFQDELSKAYELLKELLMLGPDAIIVQDLGLVKMIKEICPTQVVHASTQMTITNEQAIEFTKDLNIERYVLGRENSLSEIQEIKNSTNKELEVFVHGALCVAYSGQCFTSESIGGRSANRGQCAQSCRFEYDLIVDGVKKDLVDRNYLVSPKDLCGIEEIPKLKELGIHSLKVEGRLKSPLYVSSVASSYKKALSNDGISKKELERLKNEMALTYSRGFYPGWLNGVNHQELVDGTYGNNRGLKIGTLKNIGPDEITITSNYDLQKGDGLLFVGFSGNKKRENGSRIYSVKKLGKDQYTISFDREFELKNLKEQDDVYLNSSPQKDKEIQRNFTDKRLFKRSPLNLVLTAHIGKKLALHCIYNDKLIKVESVEILGPAKGPIHRDKIKDELSALSSTSFYLNDLKFEFSKNDPFIPNKMLKGLRRELIEQLEIHLKTPVNHELFPFELPVKNENQDYLNAKGKLRILLREISQVEYFLEFIKENQSYLASLDSVILDFEFGRDYSQSLNLLKDQGIKTAIATNRILKPNEYNHLKNLIRLNPDYILARNLGAFQFLKSISTDINICGDFSLNVSNSITADYLFKKGFESLTTSYDLNANQMLAMVEFSNNKNFEVLIHQYMPSFHMEHCVYAAFLSKGSSFKDCGKPCEKHQVELRDQFGHRHFIKADSECRNTMYNATSFSASRIVQKCLDHGISLFRIEILNENKEQMNKTLHNYFKLFLGQMTYLELENQLGENNKNIGLKGPLFC